MSDEFKKRPSFTKEKAELLKKTLGQFDEEITVETLALEESIDFSSLKDRTFLLHVLIETLCYLVEKDEYKRQKLFNSLYKGFGGDDFMDYLKGFEDLTQLRRRTAMKFYEHIKQIHQSISPLSNELIYEVRETSIPISRIEKYDEAFDELDVIAHGGFGTVCMARHKVDGGIYAVKKIIFEYRRDSDYVKVMREVRNLSSLSNKYVVAYNNAWVQPVPQDYDLNSEELDSENDYIEDESTDDVSTYDQYVDQSTDDVSVYDQSMDYSNASFVTHSYTAHSVSSCSESSSIVFQNDPNDSQASSNTNRSKSCSNHSSKTKEPQFELPNLPILRIKMMLCIQMEYCDYDLRHWLDKRNEGHDLPFSKSVTDIFKEILCGVAYIHEKEIIHRDLKPQNIFFSEAKGVMKVGDFGLATLSYTPSDEQKGSLNHSTNLGTLPYAAPEQRSNSIYDSKVDMYSLGIILIELLVKIGTKMEFFKIIENVKQGIVPEEIEQRWPQYIPLLKNLLQEDSTYRMTAKQVLDMPLFKDKTIKVSELEQKVKDLERELANKEQEFRERERALTQKLQEQEQVMEQRLKEQKWAMEQKFQEQKQAIEEVLISKEQIFQQISEEVKLLKEHMNRLR